MHRTFLSNIVNRTGQPKLYRFRDQEGEYVVDEPQILKIYYDYWAKEMTRAGHGETEIKDYKACIDDFLLVNQAEEWNYSKESWVEFCFKVRCVFCGRIRWAWTRCPHRKGL